MTLVHTIPLDYFKQMFVQMSPPSPKLIKSVSLAFVKGLEIQEVSIRNFHQKLYFLPKAALHI